MLDLHEAAARLVGHTQTAPSIQEIEQRARRRRRRRRGVLLVTFPLVAVSSIAAVALIRNSSNDVATRIHVYGRGEWSVEPITPPPGTPSRRSCVRVTVGVASHEACMDARSADVPAYWRVEGQDFVAYPDWSDPKTSSTLPRPLTVETAEMYLQKYPAPKGFGCWATTPGDPRTLVKEVARTLVKELGDALEAKYGPSPPPIMYIGCAGAVAEPVLHGDLQTAQAGADTSRQVSFQRRGDHLEIVDTTH